MKLPLGVPKNSSAFLFDAKSMRLLHCVDMAEIIAAVTRLCSLLFPSFHFHTTCGFNRLRVFLQSLWNLAIKG